MFHNDRKRAEFDFIMSVISCCRRADKVAITCSTVVSASSVSASISSDGVVITDSSL